MRFFKVCPPTVTRVSNFNMFIFMKQETDVIRFYAMMFDMVQQTTIAILGTWWNRKSKNCVGMADDVHGSGAYGTSKIVAK